MQQSAMLGVSHAAFRPSSNELFGSVHCPTGYPVPAFHRCRVQHVLHTRGEQLLTEYLFTVAG
jgi:hypothetical protein